MVALKFRAVVGVVAVAILGLGMIGVARHHGHRHLPASSTMAAGPVGRHHVSVPSGFKALTDAADGVVIDVPSSWRSAVLTPGSHADSRTFATDYPGLAAIIPPRVAKSGPPIGLLAVDPDSHATVVIESASVPADPGATNGGTTVLPGGLRDRYTELGIALVATDTVPLPIGLARRASLRLVTAGQELVASQYFLIDRSRLITLTIQGPADHEPPIPDARIAHTADRLS